MPGSDFSGDDDAVPVLTSSLDTGTDEFDARRREMEAAVAETQTV